MFHYKRKKIGGQRMKIGKEGKRKLKASLANTALFLSIFVVLFPLSMPNASASGGTIYVDDDFPGDDPGNNEFTTIQAAVLHAKQFHSGNVLICVYAGNYEEKVEIQTPVTWSTLTLQGNGSSDTIVQPPPDSPGTVITISASWVTVTGFT
jgi:pectin methylesterase-like acyl-CoA thioesterase